MKIESAVAVALANKVVNLAIVESFGESRTWKWGVHTPSVLSDEELEQEEREALESFLCGHMTDIYVRDYDGTVDVQLEVGNDINPLYLNRHEGH